MGPALLLSVVLSSGGASAQEDAEDGAALSEQQLEELLGGTGPAAPSTARKLTPADFASYFADGPRRDAKAEFDQRRYAKARVLLAEVDSSDFPARYLRALAAFYSGDVSTAADELLVLGYEYPVLSDHCALHAGEAYERLNKPELALIAYARVRSGSSAFAEARFGMSRVHRRGRDLVSAIEALAPLRALPAGPRWDAVRLKALVATTELARRKRNGRAEELNALLQIWATAPMAPQAEEAWERLKGRPVPDTWRLRRAEALLLANQNKKAMDLASTVTASLPDPNACRASFIVGNALRKERQHRRAIIALAPMIERCPTSELRPQAMYVMGYSQSVVERDGAVRTYERLAQDYAAHALADDALFFAAELYQRNADSPLALERLRDVVTRYPLGNFTAESMFKIGSILRDQGKLVEARTAFEAIERLPHASHQEVLRARYWTAQVLERSNDFAAEDLFRELAAEHPTTWYGTLARARVGALPPRAPVAAGAVEEESWALDPGPLASDPYFAAGLELLRLGLPGAASELLSADRSGLPDDAARLLASALDRVGVEKAAAFVRRVTLGRELQGEIDGRSRPIWEATFPRPFRPWFEKYALEARVDPDLLQALAREESRFNPTVRSATGALGLTQLMPATANQVALKLKLRRVSSAALLRPEVNLRLGAAYLGSLLDEFGGSLAHAVAAYNAGPDAVRRWVKARPDAELDLWVEEIPFAETRAYVKSVLASYAAYQYVYAPADRVVAR